jgi:hypothetical protein
MLHTIHKNYTLTKPILGVSNNRDHFKTTAKLSFPVQWIRIPRRVVHVDPYTVWSTRRYEEVSGGKHAHVYTSCILKKREEELVLKLFAIEVEELSLSDSPWWLRSNGWGGFVTADLPRGVAE